MKTQSEEVEIRMSRLKFAINTRITKELLNDCEKPTALIRMIGDDILLQVRGFVWAQELPQFQKDVSFPTNWMEAFRERWFPGWAKKRWPIQYRHVVLSAKAIYPKFKPSLDKRFSIHTFQQEESHE
jgi:hypothetical protein